MHTVDECKGDAYGCVEHGPFPTSWRLHGFYADEYGAPNNVITVTWERYTAPFTVEERKTRVPVTPPESGAMEVPHA